MHELVDDDLLQVLLLRGGNVQQQDGLSVVAVDLEVPGLGPGWVLDKFQLHVPGRGEAELLDPSVEERLNVFPVHQDPSR